MLEYIWACYLFALDNLTELSCIRSNSESRNQQEAEDINGIKINRSWAVYFIR